MAELVDIVFEECFPQQSAHRTRERGKSLRSLPRMHLAVTSMEHGVFKGAWWRSEGFRGEEEKERYKEQVQVVVVFVNRGRACIPVAEL